MGEVYTKPDLERICWHRVGVIYPRAGQKIMMLFRDGSIVIALYDGFRNWLPYPIRWARHPIGPQDAGSEENVVDISALELASE